MKPVALILFLALAACASDPARKDKPRPDLRSVIIHAQTCGKTSSTLRTGMVWSPLFSPSTSPSGAIATATFSSAPSAPAGSARPNRSPLQFTQGLAERLGLLRRRKREALLDGLPQPHLQFPGCFFGEGDGHDLFQGSPPLPEQGEDAVHQKGGFPGAGSRFCGERSVQIVPRYFSFSLISQGYFLLPLFF